MVGRDDFSRSGPQGEQSWLGGAQQVPRRDLPSNSGWSSDFDHGEQDPHRAGDRAGAERAARSRPSFGLPGPAPENTGVDEEPEDRVRPDRAGALGMIAGSLIVLVVMGLSLRYVMRMTDGGMHWFFYVAFGLIVLNTLRRLLTALLKGSHRR